MNPIDLNEVLASFDAAWSPRIVTRVNDYDIRLARFDGEHVWHVHENTDEFFLVLDGELEIEVEGREPFVLGPQQGVTIPRGVRHRPIAAKRTVILMVEPATVKPTGD